MSGIAKRLGLTKRSYDGAQGTDIWYGGDLNSPLDEFEKLLISDGFDVDKSHPTIVFSNPKKKLYISVSINKFVKIAHYTPTYTDNQLHNT